MSSNDDQQLQHTLIGQHQRPPENRRCCYPSKRCQNLRVVKRNGELHRLCEYHRTKANVNQRRLEERRRMRNSASSDDAAREVVHRPPHVHQEEFSMSHHGRSLPDLAKPQGEGLDLDKEDMQFLDEFLSQTDIELSPARIATDSVVSSFFDSNPDVRMSI